jgi:iron(III) transport system substrate-binding protein
VLKTSEDLFADYAPPNAADYPASSHVSAKHWPRTTVGWVIAHNSGLVQDPPKTWKDLADPKWGGGKTGHVVAIAGGTTWTRVMFERQSFGADYWTATAANKPQLFPSGAPQGDALVRGEIEVAPILLNVVSTAAQQGAPVGWFYPPEGIPLIPFAAGVTKTAPNPNAARLFMNWSLSPEGQAVMVNGGNFSSLKGAALPKGYDPAVSKLWFPDPAEFDTLRKQWVEDWNKAFNYRQ